MQEQSPSAGSRVGHVVFGVLCLVLGVALTWLQAGYALQGLRSDRLVERPARLLQPVRVVEERSPWLPDYLMGTLVVRYEVTRQDGSKSEHDRVWLHEPRDDGAEHAHELAAELEAAGASLTAWVDPQDPSLVVLYNNVNWRDNLPAFLIPASFLAAGVLFLWWGLRRRRG